MSKKRLRFAPSPTGNIHIGNTRIALMNYLLSAKEQDCEFILRIDDTDQERSKQEYIDNIRTDLNWLGFKIADEFNQSSRLELYENALNKLKEQGLAYACYETPEELEYKKKRLLSRGKPPIYDREMLTLSEEKRQEYEKEGRKAYYRFKVSDEKITWEDKAKGKIEFEGANISDPVLVRENGSFLYMLPSVVDDIDYKITDIVRGEDHIANTAIQIQMIKALGGKVPNFAHISFITNDTGQGLSKRFNDLSILKLREQGISASSITSYLFSLGTSESNIYTNLEDMAKDFSISNYGKGSVKFSIDKLKKINSHFTQNLPYEEALKYIPQDIAEDNKQEFWNIVKDNIENVNELPFWQNILFNKEMKYEIKNKELAKILLNNLPSSLNEESFKETVNKVKEQTNLKGKELFIGIRQAITSLEYGPELSKIVTFMDLESIKHRLQANS